MSLKLIMYFERSYQAPKTIEFIFWIKKRLQLMFKISQSWENLSIDLLISTNKNYLISLQFYFDASLARTGFFFEMQ